MKAFAFRLDRALRWRETQVKLQQAKVSVAAGKLAAIRSSLDSRGVELREGAAQLALAANGTALGSWAGFTVRTQRQIRELEEQAANARKDFGVELDLLKEADRKAQLIENLKGVRLGAWQREFDRQIGVFADEAFLARYNRELRRESRARSSGG